MFVTEANNLLSWMCSFQLWSIAFENAPHIKITFISKLTIPEKKLLTSNYFFNKQVHLKKGMILFFLRWTIQVQQLNRSKVASAILAYFSKQNICILPYNICNVSINGKQLKTKYNMSTQNPTYFMNLISNLIIHWTR